MAQVKDEFTRVTRPVEIEALLERLTQPGGASLLLEKPDSHPIPVLLMEYAAGESLLMDMTAVREVVGELKRGMAFRLLGQVEGKMVRTPPLKIVSADISEGRMLCQGEYPLYLEALQRRESFRARLRLGMDAGAIVRGDDGLSTQGDLRDLSLDGCQLELHTASAGLISQSTPPLQIELCFPDGTRFEIAGTPRHQTPDPARHSVRVGFRFERCSGDQERKLWYFVREIEREAMRSVSNVTEGSAPSLLFRPANTSHPIGRRNEIKYPTPMARRLARVAGYLDAQLQELQQGSDVDSVQLSRHADTLVTLADEDSDALLFATRCLSREQLPIRHGISVAVHLLALADANPMPREVRKAMAASAMLHDLGKAMLSPRLLASEPFGAEEYAQLKGHVAMILKRLARCQWLSRSVANAVIGGINERLDGSGYPEGVDGDRLHELARMAAVVDVVDAMRRDRPDRPAWHIDAVYRRLLMEPGKFDPRWVKRYVQRFGLRPVGSLVRFSGGSLAWIQRLDAQGKPSQVQLTEAVEPPGEALGEELRGDVASRLGDPVEELAVST